MGKRALNLTICLIIRESGMVRKRFVRRRIACSAFLNFFLGLLHRVDMYAMFLTRQSSLAEPFAKSFSNSYVII